MSQPQLSGGAATASSPGPYDPAELEALIDAVWSLDGDIDPTRFDELLHAALVFIGRIALNPFPTERGIATRLLRSMEQRALWGPDHPGEAAMTPDQLEDVRADIYAEPWKDPQLFADLLHKAITELGHMATTTCRCYPGGVSPASYEGPQRDCPVHGEPAYWASCLLSDMQSRARGGVPFGEPPWGDLGPTNPKDV